MSMLAEQKKKIKWSLNPRGNLWAKDENKFGQKLLEKMWWQKGKGLGKSEDGRVEHIKVSQRDNNAGVGWKNNNDSWVAHQHDFNALLDSLNQNIPTEAKKSESDERLESVSMEARSKSLKNRVHSVGQNVMAGRQPPFTDTQNFEDPGRF